MSKNVNRVSACGAPIKIKKGRDWLSKGYLEYLAHAWTRFANGQPKGHSNER